MSSAEPLTAEGLKAAIADSEAALFYFSAPTCNVCKVLRPKVEALLAQRFPEMRFRYVDVSESVDAARALQVLTLPTVVGVFAGREAFRLVRVFGIEELAGHIERPYGLLFG